MGTNQLAWRGACRVAILTSRETWQGANSGQPGGRVTSLFVTRRSYHVFRRFIALPAASPPCRIEARHGQSISQTFKQKQDSRNDSIWCTIVHQINATPFPQSSGPPYAIRVTGLSSASKTARPGTHRFPSGKPRSAATTLASSGTNPRIT